jgi:predicted transcriptional regulator
MAKKAMRQNKSETVRASASVPKDDYVELQRIAEQKRVSVSWVICDAIDRYLTNEQPLFRRS